MGGVVVGGVEPGLIEFAIDERHEAPSGKLKSSA
jgi:hypothetical protein